MRLTPFKLPYTGSHGCAYRSIKLPWTLLFFSAVACLHYLCKAPWRLLLAVPPNRDSTLTFRKVTEDNWRAVANLSPKDGQKGNLAPNVWSLCEAHYSEDAWVRAIYADETLVGMLMMAIWDPDEAYYIWRFMIDGRYQNLGYGRRGVEFAMAHIRQHNHGAKRLGVMSTPPEGKSSENHVKNVKPEDSPCKFYEKLGFRQIAPPDEDGEIMMSIDL